jgi:hypothetical protein
LRAVWSIIAAFASPRHPPASTDESGDYSVDDVAVRYALESGAHRDSGSEAADDCEGSEDNTIGRELAYPPRQA